MVSEGPSPRDDSEPAERTPFWQVPTYRFALIFGVLLLVISLGYPRLLRDLRPVLHQLEVLTSWLVAGFLGVFSDSVTLRDRIVSFGGFSVRVIDECAGVYETLFFSAAVLAYPATWSQALIGIGLGIPLLYAMNVTRIAVLLVVGRYQPELFEFMHIYFWQVTMVIMVAGTWMLWLRWVVRSDQETDPAGAG